MRLLEPIPSVICERQGSPWTGCLYMSALWYTVRQTFTPICNLKKQLAAGGSQSTQRKPTQTLGEHTNSTKKNTWSTYGFKPESFFAVMWQWPLHHHRFTELERRTKSQIFNCLISDTLPGNTTLSVCMFQLWCHHMQHSLKKSPGLISNKIYKQKMWMSVTPFWILVYL